MFITPLKIKQIEEFYNLLIEGENFPLLGGIRSILGLSCAEMGRLMGLQGSRATVSREIRRWEAAEKQGNNAAIHPIAYRMLQLILIEPRRVLHTLDAFDREGK